MAPRPIPCGVYAPTTTFFKPAPSEALDDKAIADHALRLARGGLNGLVVMGSNGEAVHCSPEEKYAAVRITRRALDDGEFKDMPIIFGATEGSVLLTVALCEGAAAAGADYALILPPSYYRPQMTRDAIRDYFVAVADASKLPILLYNFPGAVAGIDMDSDLISELAQHRNIVGAKFTCGNTGKLARVAEQARARTPGSEGSGFVAFGGFSDFTIQTSISGGSGVVAGTANVLPRLSAKLWGLCEKGEEKSEEAKRLQAVLAKADWVVSRHGVAGTKAALTIGFGYGGVPRRPLPGLTEQEIAVMKEGLKEALEVEKSLE